MSPTQPQCPPLVCNGSALRKASRRLSQLYDAVLAPCALSAAQRSILLQVERVQAAHP
jgi:hypothetical protein